LILPAGKLQTTLRLLFWDLNQPIPGAIILKRQNLRDKKKIIPRQFLYSMKPKERVFGGE